MQDFIRSPDLLETAAKFPIIYAQHLKKKKITITIFASWINDRRKKTNLMIMPETFLMISLLSQLWCIRLNN